MKNERKIGAVLSYVSIIVTTLIQLLYTPLLIRMLGQSEYGLYSLVASIIGYLAVLDLGFGNAIVVFTSKYRAQGMHNEEQKLHGMFNLVYIIIGVISVILGIVLYISTNDIFASTMSINELHKLKTMMIILTVNLFITFSFSIYSSIITAYEKFVFQKIMAIFSTLLKPLIMIPLLFLGYKSIALTIVITIVNVIVVLSNYYYCTKKLNIKIKYSGFDSVIFKTILGYSIWLFLATIVDKINWSVDQFILGAVSGTIAVSIYSVAAQINTLFIGLSTAISSVLLPKMSQMVATNATNKQLSSEFIKVGRIQYYIIFLMMSGFIIFGKEFIKIWAGPKFVTSYYVGLVLIIPLCFPLIQNLGLSIIQALNKFKFRAIMTSIMSVFNIIVSIFLAKMYGPVGAAIGTAISLIICNILIMNIYYYKVIGLDVITFWKNIINLTFPFMIPVLLIILIMRYIPINGLLGILIYGMIYTILYFISAYYFAMNHYEKDNLYKIINKLKKKV